MSSSASYEKNINIDDKPVSHEDSSRPSSGSQKHEAVVPQEEEEEPEPTRANYLTPDQEAQADVRSTFTSESGMPPAPDGGLHAWLKVFGGFLIYINIWGFTLTFGIFQTYYRTTLLPSSSASSISWIGTTQAWLLILIGVLSGPLFDLGYFRSMLFIGNFLIVLGIMMLSLSSKYWQVFLSQGICMGLGAGLLFIPSLALVGVWFDKKRNVALGIVMSGIAVGGVIYITMFDRLVRTAGFPWAIRAIGFVALACAVLSVPALLSGSGWLKRPRKRRVLFDKSAMRDPLFLIYTVSSFLTFVAYNVPYVYIPTFAREKLGSDESTAMYMLVMAIAGSFFWALGNGLHGALYWADCYVGVLYGFFSAGLVTVPSAAFTSITPDLSRLGTRLGMSWSVSSMATLIGAPIGGALLKRKGGETSFVGAQVWSGVFLLAGTFFIVLLWALTVKTLKKGWKV